MVNNYAAVLADATLYSQTPGNLDFWLGMPGRLTVLPSPNDALARPRLRGRNAITLYNGATSVVMRQFAKGTWTLTWDHLYNADADLIHAFTEGGMGRGPFALVDPTTRNVLDFDLSCTGVRSSAAFGWVASGGSLTRDPSDPPVPTSGVLDWAGAQAGDYLGAWSSYLLAGTRWVDLDDHVWTDDAYTWATYPQTVRWTTQSAKLPFYLPDLPLTFSVYLTGDAGTTVKLGLSCFDVDGDYVDSLDLGEHTLSDSWQRCVGSVPADAAADGTVYLSPTIQLRTGTGTIYVGAAQLEYSASASDWQPGYGSPRVMISADPDTSIPQFDYTSTSLTLAET